MRLWWKVRRKKSHVTFKKKYFSAINNETKITKMKKPLRKYFYWLDDKGRLYVIEENEKKMPFHPAFLKEAKFLDFFFQRVVKNESDLHLDYPYISLCGVEYNYIKVADRPIVYHSIDSITSELIYGANLKVLFDPENIRVSKEGRMYYPSYIGKYGLIRSHLALELGSNIEEKKEGIYLTWKEKKIMLKPKDEKD